MTYNWVFIIHRDPQEHQENLDHLDLLAAGFVGLFCVPVYFVEHSMFRILIFKFLSDLVNTPGLSKGLCGGVCLHQ